MPKAGARKSGKLGPARHPAQAADRAQRPVWPLREDVRRLGDEGIDVPPVFIVVCNNTTTSQLIYEWIAGFERDVPRANRAASRTAT